MTPFQRLRVLVHKLDIPGDTLHALNFLLNQLGRQLENSYHDSSILNTTFTNQTVVHYDIIGRLCSHLSDTGS